MNALELAEKLAEDRERLDKAIVSHCPVPVFTTDKTGKWLSMNEPFTRLLGIDAADALGVGWQKKLFSETAKETKNAWSDLIEKADTTDRILLKFKASDGRLVSTWATMVRLIDARWIGFAVPICTTPIECPVHCFLLHNVEANPKNLNAQVQG
jgi:PAS domain S-box-containing protein